MSCSQRYYFFKNILTLLLLFPALSVFCQHPKLKFQNYNIEDGLSQNQVHTIVQDNKGFLWFGTDEGLNRFDGHEFVIFRHDVTDSTTLSENAVHSLIIDDEGVMWIGTINGITRYYPDEERFERLGISYELATLPKGNSINQMKKDKNGNIWIAYLGSGVDMYNPFTKTFLHYTVNNKDGYRIDNDYIVALAFMPDNSTLFGSREGIQVINSDGYPLSKEAAFARYPWLKAIGKTIKSFCLTADKQLLLISTEADGLYVVNLRTNQVKNYNTQNSSLLFNNNIPYVFEDSSGNIWVGGEAIYYFDRQTGKLFPYDKEGNQGSVVDKNPILSIYEDGDKNIWFGTFRLGLLKYNPENIRILHYNASENSGLTNNQILSFNETEDGTLLIGTDGGGLFSLDKNRKSLRYVPESDKWISKVIKTMHRDKHENLWMGTWDGGLIQYNLKNKKSKIFHPDHKNFSSRHVWAITSDSVDNLWLGTLRDGLVKLSATTGNFEYFKNDPSDSLSLANNDVLNLFLDSKNTLWVGTSNGISILYPGRTSFVNIQKTGLNIIALCFFEDNEGRIWIGTNGGGIVILDRSLKVLKTISESEGLLSPTICGIESDDRDNIWISSYNGVFKINPYTFAVNQIPQIAGLQGKEFIPASSFKASDGEILFGGVNGFNIFNPDSIKIKRTPHEIVFTSLKVNNDEIKPGKKYQDQIIIKKSISETDYIDLSHDHYAFSLNFSSLTFNWQSSIVYSYLLEGFDKEWQYTNSSKTFIHYTSLDPGTYRLRVRSSFDGKQWYDHTKVLTIHVNPPWWSTFWFRTLLLLSIAGTLLIFYKMRVRFMKRQQEKLEDLVMIRTRELENSNREIQQLLHEVAEQKATIESQMNELQQIHDEIVAQRDMLEVRSNQLEKAQCRLQELNSNLEILVEKRTIKLSNALRELETFLYRASHDLRGPISSMLGLLSVARMETDAAKYHNIYNNFLHKTVVTLDRTLQKLLQKHTIEKKKILIEPLNKTKVQMMLDEILPEIPFYRPDDFIIDIGSDVFINTDRTLLSIIISNLIENAFFYSHRATNRKVMLSFKDLDDKTVIIVEDFGPGIKSEVKDKIFSMFYRGNESSNGNGLGLYLVQNILTRLHGRIEVESEESHYARFIVYLPKETQMKSISDTAATGTD